MSVTRRRWPIFPFLLAVYPVLALGAHNVYERVGLGDLLVPIGASLYVALGAWALARPLTPDVDRRALLCASVVLFFNGYGGIYQAVQSRSSTVEEWLSIWMLLAGLALLCLIAVLLRRPGRQLRGLSAYLDLSSAILVLLPLIQIVSSVNRGGPADLAATVTPSSPMPAREALPDVIVVILDSYNSSRSLRDLYGFDNSAFESALTKRGFVVPSAARSNYAHTFLSLASMLNGRYLDAELSQIRPSSNDKSLLNHLLENHLLWRVLDARGYRFAFFPTFYALTADNRNADLKYPSPSETSSEFVLVWLRMTPIVPLARSTCRFLGCDVQLFDLTPEPPSRIDWKLAQLGRVPDAHGPMFAFAHLLIPHEPFVYDAECAAREVYWPRAFLARDEGRVKAAYLAQVICVNRKMLALVDTLMARTDSSAVIILQADHGYGRLGRGPHSYDRATMEQMTERTSVFGAYYLPGAPPGLIYDSITPINVVRGVLDHYFHAGMPPVEDRVYFSTFGAPYALKRLK